MSLLQAYLQKPSTRRVLSRKPGEKGFSLIELVVVVAVLAILAAIAIPSFTSIADEARVTGAKTALANLAKECAVKLVGSNPTRTYVTPTIQDYTISATTGTLNTCGNTDVYQAAPKSGIILPTFEYDSATGAKTCTANPNAGANKNLGCTSNTW